MTETEETYEAPPLFRPRRDRRALLDPLRLLSGGGCVPAGTLRDATGAMKNIKIMMYILVNT